MANEWKQTQDHGPRRADCEGCSEWWRFEVDIRAAQSSPSIPSPVSLPPHPYPSLCRHFLLPTPLPSLPNHRALLTPNPSLVATVQTLPLAFSPVSSSILRQLRPPAPLNGARSLPYLPNSNSRADLQGIWTLEEEKRSGVRCRRRRRRRRANGLLLRPPSFTGSLFRGNS